MWNVEERYTNGKRDGTRSARGELTITRAELEAMLACG
jgi:hypothetical protein